MPCYKISGCILMLPTYAAICWFSKFNNLHSIAGYTFLSIFMVNATHTERIEVTSVQFQLTSELNATIPTFTLTCVSTGSPATTVSWRRKDGTVNNRTVTEDENHHITSQILIYPVNATYNHTLAVTGRLEGQYECRVSNREFSDRKELGVVGK